jgi:hypothetical protein
MSNAESDQVDLEAAFAAHAARLTPIEFPLFSTSTTAPRSLRC